MVTYKQQRCIPCPQPLPPPSSLSAASPACCGADSLPTSPSRFPGALLSVVGQTLTRGLAPHGLFPNTPALGVQGLEGAPHTGDTGMSKDPVLHLPTSSLRTIRSFAYNTSNLSGRRDRMPRTSDCAIIVVSLGKRGSSPRNTPELCSPYLLTEESQGGSDPFKIAGWICMTTV